MSERSGMWSGPSDRWAPHPHRLRRVPDPPAEFDRAEPTDGRHAFDRDAALTPIFTSLRRATGRRSPGSRSRGQGGPRALRLAPDPVERFHDDPPTAPIPVVPAVYALDRYPTGGYAPVEADPYATGGYFAPRADPYPEDDHPPVAYPSVAYPPDHYTDVEPYPGAEYRDVAFDPYSPGSFAPRVVEPPSRSETTAVWPRIDERTGYGPVTDTGRHHRRLAPAGW